MKSAVQIGVKCWRSSFLFSDQIIWLENCSSAKVEDNTFCLNTSKLLLTSSYSVCDMISQITRRTLLKLSSLRLSCKVVKLLSRYCRRRSIALLVVPINSAPSMRYLETRVNLSLDKIIKQKERITRKRDCLIREIKTVLCALFYLSRIYLLIAGAILLATTSNNSMILFLTVSAALSMISRRVCRQRSASFWVLSSPRAFMIFCSPKSLANGAIEVLM